MGFSNHLFPVAGKCSVSQGFKGKGVHSGIDIQTYGKHNDVMASNDGIVIRAEFGKKNSGYNNYGNIITIWHGNNQKTTYAHLKEHSTIVSVGQQVKRGQVIAKVGNTGRCYGKTGIHLHYEQRIGSKDQHPTHDTFKDPQISPALIVNTSLTNKQTRSALGARGSIDVIGDGDHDNLNGLE